MGKIKNEITELFEDCQRKYEEGGAAAVIEYVEEAIRQGQKIIMLEIQYERCEACDASMPSLNHICLVCGQPTAPFAGKFCPEPRYFNVLNAGWNPDTQRQEVEINCGDNGKLLLIKTEQGFIIDVYGQNDNVHTATIWEDDLIGDDDTICTHGIKIPTELLGKDNKEISEGDLLEESNDPRNFSDVEIEEWKKKWGQSHSEITANLGYPRSHAQSDELLVDDYFWIEKDKRWYNRSASMFTEREQAIADYLYACSTYQNLGDEKEVG